MNQAQLFKYRQMWAAACRVQGWDADDDALRRRVRVAAVSEESTRGLSEHQITRLYNRLRFLADPVNLGAAMLDADAEASDEANRCRQHLYVIDSLRFADAYVTRCAIGHCRAERENCWRKLSSVSLVKLRHTLTTRARKRDAAAKKRPAFEPRSEPYHERESTRRKRAVEREPQVVPRPAVPADGGLLPF